VTIGITVYGSPTIRNNVINGGASDLIDGSYGMYIRGGGPNITLNRIYGGNGLRVTYGIWGSIEGAAITDNYISGGESGTATEMMGIQISFAGSASQIKGNKIVSGEGTHEFFYSRGIQAQADPLITDAIIIEANTIICTDSGEGCLGVWLMSEGSSSIRNNTIVLEGFGLGITGGSNSIISNNTIVGGALSGDQTMSTRGIDVSLSKLSPSIQNNIIELEQGICVAETDTTTDPVVFKNNNLTGCSVLYLDDNTLEITNIDDVNALFETDSSGNVSVEPVLDSAQDYQLTDSSPTSVTQGGLDLSSDFDTDKAGNLRTVPWSIGAYEYD
jgi:hypothetical protein